ncbi:glucosidase 2 subunit beta-like isoform X1 [Bolinopsis microptera]|uniref:glucosidase 2 subunit beta-like isoform X1 n=1 Tax=Bolinopsis microptera TaxID=2820187 RepID=UPI0030793C12
MLVLLLALLLGTVCCIPRGADPKKANLYTGSQFHCGDGSQSFPMEYVNDDYCDCNDGSDEPGTAACSNGSFYCVNKHFKGQLISSSRVDDGICDCCDGSDEMGGQCSNNCKELGTHTAEAAKKIRREQAIGFQTRLAYVTDGKTAKARRDQDISVFATEEETLRAELEERQAYKEQVEGPAKEAKETAKAALEKVEAEKREAGKEKNRAAAELELGRIDKDNNGEISADELLDYGKSEDSLLPYEEVAEMVEGGEIETATIVDMIQTQIQNKREEQERFDAEEKKKEEKRAKKPRLRDIVPTPAPDENSDEELWGEDGKIIEKAPLDEFDVDLDDLGDSEDDYEEMEDEEEDESQDPAPIRNTVEYDPETQKLIEVFNEAESLYNEAKSRHDGAKRQLEDVQKLSNLDFGSDEEFFVLKGQCFELRDDQYKYKLCPFDRSDQDGTNIGKWDSWEKGADGVNKYNVMMYTKGNSCWQGPQRSTRVDVVCGPENQIMSASEPAKCEYAYVFATPAACTKVQDEDEIHDEL